MKINNKVGIIIVNYNGEKFNQECITSIFNSTYRNIEIIVVDNYSSDNSVEKLKIGFKHKIVIIENDENLGFSDANNIGINYALKRDCNFIMLLNNDTIIDKNMIEVMVDTSLSSGAIISPKIYYYDNPTTIWSAGARFKWKMGIPSQIGINSEDGKKYNESRTVEIATGCCLLIPIEVIEEIGFLNSEYFLYYEDTDFSIRATRAGIKIIYEPKAVMWHKVSASTGGEESDMYIYYNTRNRLYFNKKFNSDNKFFYLAYFYFTRTIKVINWLMKGKMSKIKYTIRACKDYNNKRFGKFNIQ